MECGYGRRTARESDEKIHHHVPQVGGGPVHNDVGARDKLRTETQGVVKSSNKIMANEHKDMGEEADEDSHTAMGCTAA